MKATAWAPANIALIKYWGKAHDALRLPLNSSISMNLSGASTTTSVEFLDIENDEVILEGGVFSEKEVARVIAGLDRIRLHANSTLKAKVITKNTFPKGAGAAASASGFAALTLASFAALGVHVSEKELTAFARMGSGSACRSIPDGFVLWEGEYAKSLYPHDYWDIRDVLVIVDSSMKKVSTSDGMENVQTSPLLAKRLQHVPNRIERCLQALRHKDFIALGEVCQEDCLEMHSVMQTQRPPLYYWNKSTEHVLDVLKKSNVPAFFTIDAGPNVHVFCEAQNEKDVLQLFENDYQVIINKPSKGAHVV